LPALDGLRAIAVAAVIIFHFSPARLPGGFLGVDVFFVVSGFLIARLLISEVGRSGTVACAHFWARRARRLLPAVATMTVVVLVVASVKFSSIEMHDLRAQALGTLFYVANWVLIVQKGSYFASVGRPSPFLHMWSLAIEEQFYLVLPVLFFLLRRHVARRPGVTATIAFIGAIGSTIWMAILAKPLHDPTTAYLATGAHSMGLLVGVALGVLAGAAPGWTTAASRLAANRAWRVSTTAIASVALVGVLLAFRLTSYTSSRLFHGGFLVFSIGSGIVIAMVALSPGSALARSLSFRPLVVVGLRSYSLYLWHWPVYVFLTPTSGLTGAALFWARLGVSVVLAEVSYRCIEQPFRVGYVAKRSGTRGAVVYFAAGIAVAVALVFTVAAPTALPPTSITPAAASITPSTTPVARRSRRVQKQLPQVDIFGDSTALVFGYYAGVHSNELGNVRVGGDARLGCSSLNTDKINAGILIQPPSGCAGWEQRWQTQAAKDKRAVLAIMLGAWEILDQRVNGVTLKYPDPRWSALVEASLRHAVEVLAVHGRAVHIFQLPCYGTGDPQFPIPARGDPNRINAMNDMIERIAHQVPHVSIVHWRDLVCPNGKRVEKVNGVQLWQTDNVHLTEQGVVQVWKWWLPQLRRAQN
jgi:peptidoglycan/LPS O-acetylase OafA/YrhL